MHERLTPREEVVIRRRFGFDGHDKETLEQVGLRLGFARERVRRIEVQALDKLRQRRAPPRGRASGSRGRRGAP